MSIIEIAETIRPALVGLLIQKICPINKDLAVITLSPDMEQIIINTLKDKNNSGLTLDPIFTQNMIKAIAKAYEEASTKGENCVLLTSPIIRRDLAGLIKQNIEDLSVLAFTELPESRKIKVLATIENKKLEENNND